MQGGVGGIPDLVGRDFTTERPLTKLVGDISYVRMCRGFLYPATVIDWRSKAILGWAAADHYRTDRSMSSACTTSPRASRSRWIWAYSCAYNVRATSYSPD
ncbi:hypothetical protein [Spongiactinospora sp. TRM90649]|uniref:hypothetical protein n=1 Tax=Spongiactinospora sp. TRM90649 TaxID=3031114 RepID=UPI0023F7EDB4|nr:hypothetical protein [Spongiactinospora sp. TRM90649]MDF5751837.1 hypothetical protein [Spongiactinospora sp. TRM90649]